MRKDDNSGLTHVFVAMGAVAFFVAGVPALDAMGTWIANLFGLKSVKLNHEASKYAVEEEDGVPVQAVGFQIPSEEMEEVEDE